MIVMEEIGKALVIEPYLDTVVHRRRPVAALGRARATS